MAAYLPPLDTFLTLGEPRFGRKWTDYSTYGVTREHIPDLIRMATDPALQAGCDSKEIWAPVHAWRALGQVQAAEAIEPLLDLLEQAAKNDDDWALNDLPTVLAMTARRSCRRWSSGDKAARAAVDVVMISSRNVAKNCLDRMSLPLLRCAPGLLRRRRWRCPPATISPATAGSAARAAPAAPWAQSKSRSRARQVAS